LTIKNVRAHFDGPRIGAHGGSKDPKYIFFNFILNDTSYRALSSAIELILTSENVRAHFDGSRIGALGGSKDPKYIFSILS
jgi:hypothetical protein